MNNRTEERPGDATSQSASPSLHLRAPFRQFWFWWGFWALLFPLLGLLAEWLSAGFTRWVVILVWMLLFFWSARRPMQVWLQRPKPVWLFFVLWMAVPFALVAASSVLLTLVGL